MAQFSDNGLSVGKLDRKCRPPTLTNSSRHSFCYPIVLVDRIAPLCTHLVLYEYYLTPTITLSNIALPLYCSSSRRFRFANCLHVTVANDGCNDAQIARNRPVETEGRHYVPGSSNRGWQGSNSQSQDAITPRKELLQNQRSKSIANKGAREKSPSIQIHMLLPIVSHHTPQHQFSRMRASEHHWYPVKHEPCP